jgi:hypothetical protein
MMKHANGNRLTLGLAHSTLYFSHMVFVFLLWLFLHHSLVRHRLLIHFKRTVKVMTTQTAFVSLKMFTRPDPQANENTAQ